MSDVEWICEQNHQRVRWAEEITSQSRQSRDSSPQGEPRAAGRGCHALQGEAKKEAKRRGLRMAAMGCAVFTGAGLSIVVRGAQMVHMPTLISGILITIVCLTAGWLFDELAEGMLR